MGRFRVLRTGHRDLSFLLGTPPIGIRFAWSVFLRGGSWIARRIPLAEKNANVPNIPPSEKVVKVRSQTAKPHTAKELLCELFMELLDPCEAGIGLGFNTGRSRTASRTVALLQNVSPIRKAADHEREPDQDQGQEDRAFGRRRSRCTPAHRSLAILSGFPPEFKGSHE